MQKLIFFFQAHKNKLLVTLLILLALVLLIINSFNLLYWNRIFPGVKILNQDFGGLTQDEAREKIKTLAVADSLVLTWQNNSYAIRSSDINLKYDTNKTITQAYVYGRAGKPLTKFANQIQSLTNNNNVPLEYSFDEAKLDAILATISAQINIPVIEPSISIDSKQIVVNPGKNGQQIETDKIKDQIYKLLAYGGNNKFEIPVEKINPELTDAQITELQNRAQHLLGKSLNITFEYQTFTYRDTDLVNLLAPVNSTPSQHPGVNEEKVTDLITNIAQSVERPPQDAKFVFEEGRVKEFTPGKDGIKIKSADLINSLSDALNKLENMSDKTISINIPVEKTSTEVSTEDVNTLGIKELIGHGESYYKGSIPSRVHNLTLATERLNGIIIKPGDEFSFNGGLGEVSTSTGYEQAFVIKQGKTILDDGGGVCQVSTTLFRAALNTGLPITERHPHSYRVSYYEQGTKPGIDATIYQPGVDLKFKNDTGNNILIQSHVEAKLSKLTFDLYGTADGRVAEVGNFRLWDITPPPPALYTDDPTLPAGTTKQTEHAIPGAKASFDYKVTRNGEVIQNRTFYSNYQAWQAVYLLGPGATAPTQQ